jgi:hypothetical protein
MGARVCERALVIGDIAFGFLSCGLQFGLVWSVEFWLWSIRMLLAGCHSLFLFRLV